MLSSLVHDHPGLMEAVHIHAPALAQGLELVQGFGAIDVGLGAPMAALFTGLAVGATHCVGMCGPFILPQVLARVQTPPDGALERLRRAALLPYHLGRLTTYTGLGVAAGGITGFVTDTTGFRTVLALFLLVAAASFALKLWRALAGPASRLAIVHNPVMAAMVSRIHRIAGRAVRLGPFGLGLALGFLPCGFVYAAVAAAAGTGSALIGGLTLAAFGLGTMPGLVAVGYFGTLAMRRWQWATRFATVPLLALNVVVLTLMAARTIA
ncbi:MAG TPA: sulfite exporter TauE/SafE family protein [Alphaproteobacteria bacterium]